MIVGRVLQALRQQKAKIVSVADSSKSVTVHFNPDHFDINQSARWRAQETLGGDVPQLTFVGGSGESFQVEFLFDTTDTGKDVRTEYELLQDFAEINPNKVNPKTGKGEPDPVQFQWGRFLSFTAVIEHLTQHFTMFAADGTPLRARVGVRFREVPMPVKRQNPTSQSMARKTRMVLEGETLDWIAYQEYGEAAHWRWIAECNGLADPKTLSAGQVLQLPPLP